MLSHKIVGEMKEQREIETLDSISTEVRPFESRSIHFGGLETNISTDRKTVQYIK